jgi:hypothetical protein
MLRLLILTISILYSCVVLSKPSYQIDLILFANPQNANQNYDDKDLNTPLIPNPTNAITLHSNAQKTYSLLPPSQSNVRDEFYLLSRKSNYKVLGSYSWTQPANNESRVALPTTNHNGWLIQGTVRLRQQNYYLFEADLQCSPPNNSQSTFQVKHKQRLKNELVYFLDNPKVGMIVKVHQLS